MLVTKEVGKYEVVLISGYENRNQIGFVYFYEPSQFYIGYAGIIKSDASLPCNVQWSNGVLNIYFHETLLGSLLDTLRNERPVYVKYDTDLKWGSVGTNQESVGEQEVPVAP